MPLDGKLLGRAKTRLDEKRRAHEAEYARRRDEVYAKSPNICELDLQIKASIIDVIGLALSHGEDPRLAIEEISRENLDFQEEREQELISAGFPQDYLDESYLCEKCRDTGFADDGICSCLMELYAIEQRLSLSHLLKLGDETFDSFDLSWYDDTPDSQTGVSPRRNMEIVYETCVQYAMKFGQKSYNLFFTGAPGLGKTFLSACIARVVSERGFSVVYDMASSIFTRLEEERFSKSEDVESVRSDIKRYFECDLLIMDDLGTEMTTSFTISALYELINTRLLNGKKTIISSNLSPEEIRRRYSSQIISRLEGEYHMLKFYGRDIRLLKKDV